MIKNSSKDETFRFTLFGFLTGLTIYVLFIVTHFLKVQNGFSISELIQAYSISPSYWIPTVFVFILAFLGGLLGKFIEKKEKKAIELLDKDVSKTEKILSFTQKLIEQQIDVDYEFESEDDVLGQTLIKLRNTIKENKEQEDKRRNEDEQRHWVSEGLAKFGEILRSDNDNMEELSYKVISNLVKYVDANQGGFFILNDEDPDNKTFDLGACYAYDRKKYADKSIKWGEGLIGTCALERQTIHLTEIPDSYINITSGLGRANPDSLLIVPLIVNDEIHGVIELASFNIFQPFEIEFIEKVAESISTTISSVKITITTSQLLKDSQEQAEALASQEEQMRQNMEELQATQEEATRQSQKFISFTNSVNHTLIRAEYSTDGILLYANTKFLKKLGYSANHEVEGKHISMFINEKDREWFDGIWENLSKGGRHFEGYMKHMTKQVQDLWTMATYTCVRNEMGEVEKILFLAIDTTDQKKQSLDYEGQIQALDRSSMKVIFSPEGKVLECNQKFCEVMGYKLEETRQKTYFDFLAKEDWSAFKEIWKQVLQGKPFEGQLKGVGKNDDEKWFNVTYSAVNDMYNEVSKVIYIAHDITLQKLMEFETQRQTEKLKVQEEKLRQAGEELQKKLEKAKADMSEQFKEIEKTKIRNERTLEGALDAIITINEFGNVEFFNKAAEDLWEIKRRDVIGRDVKLLFSEEAIENDDFVRRFVLEGEQKIIGERREVPIKKTTGEEAQVLFLLSDATVENEHTYTAFIQNVEVELF